MLLAAGQVVKREGMNLSESYCCVESRVQMS